MAKVIPSMSTRGWLTSVPEQVDAMLSNFFTANTIQTIVFAGNIHSIQSLLQQYQHDIPTLVTTLEQTLEVYFSGVFDQANVQVEAVDEDETIYGLRLKIYIYIVNNGKEYSVAKLIEDLASKFKRIVNYNNEGTLS